MLKRWGGGWVGAKIFFFFSLKFCNWVKIRSKKDMGINIFEF